VALEEITLQRATELGVPRQGVLVTDVVGEPARKAGITAGDVVLTWNGQAVSTPAELSWKVAATETGKSVPVTIWRDGRELELTVQVGERRL
jgi:Trypsin-like serine proteases, typically periplasmic, contain C-terminal PDZ domain